MTAHTEWVTRFDAPLGTDLQTERLRLGGKGLSLQRMTHEGYRVPPGFTIATTACQHFIRRGTWPDGLWKDVVAHVRQLEQSTGARFAQSGQSTSQPLTVAVRSGAADSMPGMLASVLHCGTSPDMVRTQPQLLTRYVAFVVSLAWSQRIDLEAQITAVVANASLPNDTHQVVEAIDACYASQLGEPLPADPWDQLRLSVTRVWQSWSAEAATAYRQARQLDSAGGTAVNIQMMLASDFSGVAASVDPTAGSRPHVDRIRCRIGRSTGRRHAAATARSPAPRHGPDPEPAATRAAMRRTCRLRNSTAFPPGRQMPRIHRGICCRNSTGRCCDWSPATANRSTWSGVWRTISSGCCSVAVCSRRSEPAQRHTWTLPSCGPRKSGDSAGFGNSLRVWVRHPLSESLPRPRP